MASKSDQDSESKFPPSKWDDHSAQRLPLYDGILDACGVTSGTFLVDAGCGSGGLALRASLRGVRVAGFDISEEMIALAQTKVADGDFRLGELNDPPFKDDTFDVAVSCECLFFAPDQVNAIQQLNRICKKQGKVAIAVQGPPEISDSSRMHSFMQALLPEPPKLSHLSLSSVGKLEDLIEKAGLKVDDSLTVPCPYNFDSFDTYWSRVRDFGGIKNIIEAVGEKKALAAALEGAKTSINDAGEVRFNNAFRLVIAHE